MRNKLLLTAVVLCLVAAVLSCGPANTDEQEKSRHSQLVAQGKDVFVKHQCDRCHYIGDEEVESEAPDLTDPLLANDSLFIIAHLKFVEASQMPPLQLTEQENHQLSYFISHLHAAKQPPLEVEADNICSVCYAPVSMQKAKQRDLFVKFVGRSFYFECEACKTTFKKAPEAFIEMLRRYEIAAREN